jgi:hypothetical protein
MMSTDRWSFGDAVIYRGLWKGHIWWALPVRVVQDTRELIALYWPAGTPSKRTAERATARDIFLNPQPTLADRHWTDTDILTLCDEKAAYSINAMWSAKNGVLLCWYVNLQEPLHRKAVGFETEDHLLDIVFQPDLSGWEWKDEDELAQAVELGEYSKQKVHEIYAAAEEAIESIMSGRSWISDKWSTWHAPNSWDVLELPQDWDASPSDPYRQEHDGC